MKKSAFNKIIHINKISIIIYALVYYLAFYDVEEILVTRYYDGNLNINRWDYFSMIMFWVGISLVIELMCYRFFRANLQSQKNVRYIFANLIQLVTIMFSLFIAMTNIEAVELFDRRDITINFFCCVLIALMFVQLILWVCRNLLFFRKRINVNEDKVEKAHVLKDNKNKATKILLIALRISTVMYLFINFIALLHPVAIIAVILFGMVTIVIPSQYFLYDILDRLIYEKKYIYAITVIICYIIVLNNIYRHLVDRYFYDGNVETIWINLTVEFINILLAIIAIVQIIVKWRKEIEGIGKTNELASLNNLKKWKGIIISFVLIFIFMPIEGKLDKYGDYVYTGLLYEVKYENLHEYEELGEVVGIQINLLGNRVLEWKEIVQ